MKYKNLILAFTTITFIVSCSNSSGDDLSETPDPDPNPTTKITYNANIKSILSNNCTNCHGNPTTNGAPMSLITYTQVVNAIQNRGLINRINSTTNPMPQSGLMSKENRDLFQQWIDDGLLEN